MASHASSATDSLELAPQPTGKAAQGAPPPLSTAASPGPLSSAKLHHALPGILLLAAYYLLSLLNSPAGYLSPDTGGKVATLKAMAAHHTFTNVDVGYWAARWDPHGLIHPLYYTSHIGDRWVQVTTLPMVLAGSPLYRLGGYRLALLLPMLGALACAYAARALAGRFGADRRRQWWAFWLVGLASPVTIYALDFWEHTIGLAFMAWGVVALLDVQDAPTNRRRLLCAVLAGMAFGTAATMRTEALIYFAVAAAIVGIAFVVRSHHMLRWLPSAVCIAAGALVMLGLGRILSMALIGDAPRGARAASAAGLAGHDLASRLRDGLVTTVGLTAVGSGGAILLGTFAALALGVAAYRGRRGLRALELPLLIGLLGSGCLVFLGTFAGGLGWMSGFTAAAPLTIAGMAYALRSGIAAQARLAAMTAVLALPVVWLFQWSGGATIGWGGRYVLATTFLLVVLGVVSLPSLRAPVAWVFVALAVATTAFGLSWMSVATHDEARAMRQLNARPEPVLIANGTIGQLPRYGGASYGDHRWLTTTNADERLLAARVVEAAGYDSFAMVNERRDDPPRDIGNFVAIGSSSLELFGGTPLTVTSYSLASSGARN